MQGFLAHSQEWLNPWQSRQLITATNYHHEDIYNYQTRVEVPYKDCMDSLFKDIRFVDTISGKVYDQWIEYSEPGVKAVVWVEIDTLVKYTPKQIWLYYNNSSAEDISDPNSVFIFYDDFNNDDGWNMIGDSSTSITMMDDSTTILSKNDLCGDNGVWKNLGDTISNFKLISRDYKSLSSPDSCTMHEYGVEDAGFIGFNFSRDGSNTNANGAIGLLKRENAGVSNVTLENADQEKGKWFYTEVSYCHICLFNLNAVLRDTSMTSIANVYSSDYNIYDFDRFTLRGGFTYNLDYMAVAQKACIEPVLQFDEVIEECPESSLISHTADYCEEGEGEIIFTVQGGTAPYDITWFLEQDTLGSQMAMSQDTIVIDNLSVGIYTIKVRDASGCEN